eukprot:Pgem_evm1s18699
MKFFLISIATFFAIAKSQENVNNTNTDVYHPEVQNYLRYATFLNKTKEQQREIAEAFQSLVQLYAQQYESQNNDKVNGIINGTFFDNQVNMSADDLSLERLKLDTELWMLGKQSKVEFQQAIRATNYNITLEYRDLPNKRRSVGGDIWNWVRGAADDAGSFIKHLIVGNEENNVDRLNRDPKLSIGRILVIYANGTQVFEDDNYGVLKEVLINLESQGQSSLVTAISAKMMERNIVSQPVLFVTFKEEEEEEEETTRLKKLAALRRQRVQRRSIWTKALERAAKKVKNAKLATESAVHISQKSTTEIAESFASKSDDAVSGFLAKASGKSAEHLSAATSALTSASPTRLQRLGTDAGILKKASQEEINQVDQIEAAHALSSMNDMTKKFDPDSIPNSHLEHYHKANSFVEETDSFKTMDGQTDAFVDKEGQVIRPSEHDVDVSKQSVINGEIRKRLVAPQVLKKTEPGVNTGHRVKFEEQQDVLKFAKGSKINEEGTFEYDKENVIFHTKGDEPGKRVGSLDPRKPKHLEYKQYEKQYKEIDDKKIIINAYDPNDPFDGMLGKPSEPSFMESCCNLFW